MVLDLLCVCHTQHAHHPMRHMLHPQGQLNIEGIAKMLVIVKKQNKRLQSKTEEEYKKAMEDKVARVLFVIGSLLADP